MRFPLAISPFPSLYRQPLSRCPLPILAATALALDLPHYPAMKIFQKPGILEVTLHNTNSEINLWGEETQAGVIDLVQHLQTDNETKVVIFNSDVPNFFTAHMDPLVPELDAFGLQFASLMYNISALPQVTIGAVEGIARGAGNKFLVALDMRFATKQGTLLGQPEVGFGAIPKSVFIDSQAVYQSDES